MCTLTLASCGTPQENLKEMQDMKPLCEAQGKEVQFDAIGVWQVYCIENKVQVCINKYIASIRSKYDNPDTVSNLSDSSFSEAVKTCNEVFGKK